MKRMTRQALMAMMMAAVAAGTTGCAESGEESVVSNPNYNPETNTVNTQFVFNVATSNTTRMAASTVQMTGFRGIEGVHIMAYKQSSNGQHVYNTATADAATAYADYDLGQLVKSGEMSEAASRRVVELALPVGTNSLLFYGKAPKTNGSAGQGSVVYNVNQNAQNTSFSINPRLTNKAAFDQAADMLATIMTRIAKNGLHMETKGDANGNNETRDLRYDFWWPCTYENVNGTGVYKTVQSLPQEVNANGDLYTLSGSELEAAIASGTYTNKQGTVYTRYTGTKEWYEYGDAYVKNHDSDPTNDVVLKPLEDILAVAYNSFANINVAGGEIRAGSGQAVLRLVHDLWSVTDKVADAEPTSPDEHIAKMLGNRISTRFSTYFQRDGGGVVKYKDIDPLKTAIATYVYGKSTEDYADVDDVTDFPTNLGLPMGAAQMTYDSATHSFGYKSAFQIGQLGSDATTPDKFLYPAELCYFGNSPVRTSDASHDATQYPNTVSSWDTDTQWSSDWTKNSIVSSNTRSVAMQNDVNYGTSLLRTTVRYSAGALNDNNKAIHPTESDNSLDVSTAETGTRFQLTGVIVGGQCREVGWNYLYRETTGNDFNYMIYDNTVESGLMKPYSGDKDADATQPNYTLVWDNWNSSLADDKQSPVYVALEFKNNGGDFWGKGNLVRANGTFYLIGKLDPQEKNADGTAKYTFPSRVQTNHALPPYKSNGDTQQAVRVFMQDYMTKADFIIGPTSLHNAYVTVPDLRASQISLGLSVDLKWETGIEFNNIVLGE